MKATLLTLTVLAATITNAQNWQWAIQGGGTTTDIGNSVVTDATGNSYVTGEFEGTATFDTITLTSAGGVDIFIAKFNSSGAVQWATSAGGTANDRGNGIAIDANGNSYITGEFNGTANFDAFPLTSAGFGDIFIAKYDASGNAVWAKRAGTSSNNDGGFGIATDTSGNCYATGWFKGLADFELNNLNSGSNDDVFIAKYDASGNNVWAIQAGGSGMDAEDAKGISVDASGNSYVTGRFNGTATFDTITLVSIGTWDLFVAKYNSAGNVQWVRQADGCDSYYWSYVDIDDVGNSYVTGRFKGTATFDTISVSSSGQDDIFLAKYNSSGAIQWVKTATNPSNDISGGITTTDIGESYITGTFQDTISFGTYSLISPTGGLFVAKYDNSGNVIWAKEAHGPSMDNFRHGNSIGIDGSGNYYVTGYINTVSTFDTITLSTTNSEMFLAKLSNCVPPIANFGFSGSGLSVNFSDSSSNPTSWYWDFGDGNTDTIQNPSHTYANDSTYIVCLTASSSCGTSTVCDTLTVCAPMIAGFTYSDTALTVNFSDTSSGNITSWYWTFGDGNNDTVPNPTHTYATSGSYWVCLTITNFCGTDSVCDSVTLTIVGIPDLAISGQVRVFPNPFDHSATLTFNNPDNLDHTLTLFDGQGRLVRTLTGITTGQVIIERKNLTSGLYYYQLRSDRQVRAIGKLTIE